MKQIVDMRVCVGVSDSPLQQPRPVSLLVTGVHSPTYWQAFHRYPQVETATGGPLRSRLNVKGQRETADSFINK